MVTASRDVTNHSPSSGNNRPSSEKVIFNIEYHFWVQYPLIFTATWPGLNQSGHWIYIIVIIMYYIVWYCSILCNIGMCSLQCVILHYVLLYFVIFYCAIYYVTILCYILCFITSCLFDIVIIIIYHAILCSISLSYTVPEL